MEHPEGQEDRPRQRATGRSEVLSEVLEVPGNAALATRRAAAYDDPGPADEDDPEPHIIRGVD